MTILRSGATKQYSENWGKAFGQKKKATKKKTAKKKATKAKAKSRKKS